MNAKISTPILHSIAQSPSGIGLQPAKRGTLAATLCHLFALVVSVLVSGFANSQEKSSPKATFLRGLNLNGPSVEIDGNLWQENDSPHFKCNGSAFENTSVVLKPKTDAPREAMIRSSRWGSSIEVELSNIEPGDYRIFLYTWEDNSPERFQILVNNQIVVERFSSGSAGQWKRLGPWNATANHGTLKVSAKGGAANFSGIELWSASGEIPDPLRAEFNRMPTDQQLDFFESKIRPILVDHCYECHSAGASELGGGLLLDSQHGITKGGDTSPPVIPMDPDSSLLMTAIQYSKSDLQMPPAGKLADQEIQNIRTWIEMGAPDPRSENTVATLKAKKAIDWDKARDFWSLRPLSSPTVPTSADADWALSDIDRFVFEGMKQNGLAPSADTSRASWIRRATYDLAGLPPTPEQIDAFLADASVDAYATVVDRLLASNEYGERWGRHWLDVVRYSDTAGDNSDFPIPQMIKYRDWVIDAFRDDMPYDQFVHEQLAGDLLPSTSNEDAHRKWIATGYVANARRFGSRVDDYPTHLTIEDTLDNVGRAFLATTINCARCHDHKFDPVTAEDYYALYGVFNSTRYPWPGIELEQKQRDLVPLVSAAEAEQAKQLRAVEQKPLDEEVKSLEQQKKDLGKEASDADKKHLEELIKKARDEAESNAKKPLPFELAYAVGEAKKIADVPIQIKGDPNKVGEVAPRHFLTVLGGHRLAESDRTSGRLQLAHWITDRENPLTARVMVNRLWLYHFGRGIVPTPNDFGRQGKPPSHSALLDWLAVRFMDSGWSTKSMHRLIMLSRVYRMNSIPSAQARESDPSNTVLSHFPRLRLDAESIRDALLMLGGNLDSTRGPTHPFPPQSQWKFTQHNPFKAVYETNHRSVYLMTQRIQRHPFLAIFDGADPAVSTPSRPVSTTPLQALYFMNDPFVHKQAAGFAERVLSQDQDRDDRLRYAYRMALGRIPTTAEVESSARLLDSIGLALAASNSNAKEVESQSWQSLLRSVFRLNEFVYLD